MTLIEIGDTLIIGEGGGGGGTGFRLGPAPNYFGDGAEDFDSPAGRATGPGKDKAEAEKFLDAYTGRAHIAALDWQTKSTIAIGARVMTIHSKDKAGTSAPWGSGNPWVLPAGSTCEVGGETHTTTSDAAATYPLTGGYDHHVRFINVPISPPRVTQVTSNADIVLTVPFSDWLDNYQGSGLNVFVSYIASSEAIGEYRTYAGAGWVVNTSVKGLRGLSGHQASFAGIARNTLVLVDGSGNAAGSGLVDSGTDLAYAGDRVLRAGDTPSDTSIRALARLAVPDSRIDARATAVATPIAKAEASTAVGGLNITGIVTPIVTAAAKAEATKAASAIVVPTQTDIETLAGGEFKKQLAAAVSAGSQSGISVTYNPQTGALSFAVSGSVSFVQPQFTAPLAVSGVTGHVSAATTIRGDHDFSWAVSNASFVQGYELHQRDTLAATTGTPVWHLLDDTITASPTTQTVRTVALADGGDKVEWRLTGTDTNGDAFGSLIWTTEYPTADKYLYWGPATEPDVHKWLPSHFANSKHSSTPALAGSYTFAKGTGNAYIGFLVPHSWGAISSAKIGGIDQLANLARTANAISVASTAFDAYRTTLQDTSYWPTTYVLA